MVSNNVTTKNHIRKNFPNKKYNSSSFKKSFKNKKKIKKNNFVSKST